MATALAWAAASPQGRDVVEPSHGSRDASAVARKLWRTGYPPVPVTSARTDHGGQASREPDRRRKEIRLSVTAEKAVDEAAKLQAKVTQVENERSLANAEREEIAREIKRLVSKS